MKAGQATIQPANPLPFLCNVPRVKLAGTMYPQIGLNSALLLKYFNSKRKYIRQVCHPHEP